MIMIWCVAKYGDPYSECVLYIQPIQEHTHSSEHTPGAVLHALHIQIWFFFK